MIGREPHCGYRHDKREELCHTFQPATVNRMTIELALLALSSNSGKAKLILKLITAFIAKDQWLSRVAESQDPTFENISLKRRSSRTKTTLKSIYVITSG